MSIDAREGPAPPLISTGMGWLAGAGLTLWFSAAGLLVIRRLSNALSTPLPPSRLVLVGAVVALLVFAVRRAIIRSRLSRRQEIAWEAGLSIAVLGIGLSLWLPGTSGWAVGLFWSLLALEEAGGWAMVFRGVGAPVGKRRANPLTKWPAPGDRGEQTHAVVPVSLDPAPASQVQHPTSADPSVTRQFTRRRTAEGGDELIGWLRVEFSAGQRTEHAHLAFCPAFVRTPRLAVEHVDGPRARIKTAQLLPYGARVDLKLSSPAPRPDRVTLRIAAVDLPVEGG